jgi:hypothetical protein
MHIASSVTSLSWIPQGAVEGFNGLSFGLRVAHYDPPPSEAFGDLDQLQATDRFRFVNRLEAWIEVQDGSSRLQAVRSAFPSPSRAWSGPAPSPATGSMTTRVGWSPRAGSSTTTPGGGRRSAPTPPGVTRTRPRS